MSPLPPRTNLNIESANYREFHMMNYFFFFLLIERRQHRKKTNDFFFWYYFFLFRFNTLLNPLPPPTIQFFAWNDLD